MSSNNPTNSPNNSLARSIVEVAVVGAIYIAASLFLAANINLSNVIFDAPSGSESRAVGSLIDGAIGQLLVIAAITPFSATLREAIRNSLRTGPKQAWFVALMAAAIHAGTLAAVFIEQPSRIVELSYVNGIFSLVPAIDGWSQEIMFRGYVIYRLAHSGAPIALRIGISALLFAAIHIGYTGASPWEFIWPMLGTAILGGLFAWSVIIARGGLLPVVTAHILLIAIVQPWLSLS